MGDEHPQFLFWDPLRVSEINQARKLKFGTLQVLWLHIKICYVITIIYILWLYLVHCSQWHLRGNQNLQQQKRNGFRLAIYAYTLCITGPAQSSPRCTKCNSPLINGQCTNHRIVCCCIIVTQLLCGFNVPIKGLIRAWMCTYFSPLLYTGIHKNWTVFHLSV